MAADSIRYGEDACVSFAIFCDENGLTVEQGRDLAERLGKSLMDCADYRETYIEGEVP